MFWSKVKQLLGLHKHKALAQKGKKSHRSDDQTAAYRFKKFVDANLVTKEGTIEYKLAKSVAKKVVGLSREEVQKFYIYHLTRMRLMTEEGQWKNDLGKKIALPDVDGNGLADKCFKSATLLTDNFYLHEYLLAIDTGLKGDGHANRAYPVSYGELVTKMNSLLPCGKTQKVS